MENPLAIIVFAVGGERYVRYVGPLIASLRDFFPPHDIVLITDSQRKFEAIKIGCDPDSWHGVVLGRFKSILAQRELLSKYGQIFLLDADMLVCGKVEPDEIFTDGLAATLHPSYPTTFDRRRESAAFVDGNPTYFHTCPIGGSRDAFFALCDAVAAGIEADAKIGIKAKWDDESHVNCYLAKHPPVRILTPAYCFPEAKYVIHPERWMKCDPKDFRPKVRHLEKRNEQSVPPQDALIAVCTSRKEKYRLRLDAQQETWIVDARSRGWNVEVFDAERLGVSDDYLDAPRKTKALVGWALSRGYRHLLKIDDDGYLVPSRLKVPSGEYAGIPWPANDNGVPASNTPPFPVGTLPFDYASGGAYWLGPEAMRILDGAELYGDWAEDRWVGNVLGRAGITVCPLSGYVLFQDMTVSADPNIERKMGSFPDATLFSLVQNESVPLLNRLAIYSILEKRHSPSIKNFPVNSLMPDLNGFIVATQVPEPEKIRWLHKISHGA